MLKKIEQLKDFLLLKEKSITKKKHRKKVLQSILQISLMYLQISISVLEF